ncbi:DUF262 domain-containing protein [Chamaesiphon minutus]|uniref:GmrSD restriction endonucleases N-terminal domain-containing protein n=1 Tax=Chamaesiphon minutus (strain ATCC 27169 / PCC 6605) TaxID=1173020 RepID=K9UE31_CHAP6|nr:DUF262 domain-containing protein [Chamaesiphon minutus]AFY93090.1 Protein of unknown function DUF262 [Chamaesiphon minutus PCC 6605]
MENDSLLVQDRLIEGDLNNLYEFRLKDKLDAVDTISSLYLLRSVESGKLVYNSAPYRNFTPWNTTKKSRLIESFLLGIQSPPLVLYQVDDEIDEIIDGEQRVKSIVDFLTNNFKLEGLKLWHELNGMAYEDLPNKIKEHITTNRLQTTTVLINSICEFDPEIIKQTTYERLNDWRIT